MSARRLRLQALENRIAPAIIQWDGGPTGDGANWLDPINWKGDVVPGLSDYAQLDSTGTNPTISIGGAASVQLIASTRALAVGVGGTLSVGAGSSLLSSVALNGGSVDFKDGLTVSAASFHGSGTLTIASGRTVTLTNCSSAIAVDIKGTLIVGFEFSANGPMNISNGGVVRVAGDTSFTSLNVYGGLTNHGLLELTSTAAGQKAVAKILGGSLTNAADGKITARVGLGGAREIYLAAAANQLVNQGSCVVEGGLNITRSGSGQLVANSGSITVNAGQLLNVDATMNFTGGSLTGGGSVSLNALKLDAALTPSLASLSLSGLTGTGKLTVSATGKVTARPGANLQAPIDHSGLLVIHGSCSIGAGFTSKPGSTIRVEGEPGSGSAFLHTTAALNNHGTVELTSAVSTNNSSLIIDSGSFVNATDGTIKVLSGVGGSRFLNVMGAGQFTNQGLLTVLGTDLFYSGPTLVNAGNLNIGLGTTLSTIAVVTNNSPGIIKGAGTIKSDSFSGTGTITPDGTIRFNSSANLGGLLVTDLNGTSAGSFDQLKVQGVVNLAGPLTINIGFAAKVNDEFQILDNDGSDSITGSFSNLSPDGKIVAGGATLQVNMQGGTGNDVTLKVLSMGATSAFATMQVNGGNPQRSMVTALQVVFSEPVTFPSGLNAGFRLQRVGPGGLLGDVQLSITGSGADYDLTFDDPTFAPGPTLSLIDGLYAFTLDAMKIQGAGGPFNGGVDQSWNLHRLFGDADGNATVNSNDFAVFRSVFGTGSSIFDFDGNNSTNSDDFAAFRMRFGITLVF